MQECQLMQSLNVSRFFSVSTRLMAIGLVFYSGPQCEAVFFNINDKSASTTAFRRRLLQAAGVGVSVESVVRERATSAKEVVRGRSPDSKRLCFLKLNFDPNYEEVEEFQWNRKRRFDQLLVFGGRGPTMEEAEADAWTKAVQHLKTVLATR